MLTAVNGQGGGGAVVQGQVEEEEEGVRVVDEAQRWGASPASRGAFFQRSPGYLPSCE